MRFGAHSYIWAAKWSDDTLHLLDKAKELGLDCLEISTGDDVSFSNKLTRRRAEDAGIKLVLSPGGLWPMDCDISSPDPPSRRKGIDWHRRSLDTAAEVGAEAYAGALYGHPGRVERRKPTVDEYHFVAELLHILAEYARERHVTLVLEPMSHFRTHLVNRPEQIVELIRLADHTNLGVLLDTFHLITEIRDYSQAIRTVGPLLWGLHACENDRGVPGAGLIPWRAIFHALRETGFDGYIGLESYNSGASGFAASRGLFGSPCPDADAFVAQGLSFLRDVRLLAR